MSYYNFQLNNVWAIIGPFTVSSATTLSIRPSTSRQCCNKMYSKYIVTCISDYRRILDWMIWFIAPYTFTTRDYRQFQRYCWSIHFPAHRYTCTRVLFSIVVSRQRIYNSLTVTSNHTRSPLCTVQLFSCHYCLLNSIPLLRNSYPGRLASRNSTLHPMLLSWILLYNHFARILGKRPSSIAPYCFRRVYHTVA
jgi:hypothetical protein